MNKNEILNMEAGREMDALIAEKVMGGFVEGDPEGWSKKEEIWFYVHSGDGVLIGTPYEVNPEPLREGNEPALYSHSWRMFEPSTNIADAWLVVEKLPNFSVGRAWKLNGGGAGYHCWAIGENAFAETAPLAICRAALLTIQKGNL